MPPPGFLVLLVFLAGSVLVAPGAAAEIRKLDGSTILGEVLSLNSAELLYRADGQDHKLAVRDLMAIDLVPQAPAPARVPYLRVRLIDGTLLYCLALGVVNKTATLQLLGGPRIDVHLDALHHVLCEAQDTASLAAFDALLAENPRQDIIRVLSKDGKTIDPYEGAILGANDTGTRLQFKAQSLENVSNIDVSRLRAMYFSRGPSGSSSRAIARIQDVHGNNYTCSAYSCQGEDCRLTTLTGIVLSLPRTTIQKFDLTPGKLAYLSDLEPTRVEEVPILADLHHFRRDKNLEGGPLSVGRRVYAKGLALHSKAILEYDVAGYSTFRTVLGLDDAMTGPAHATVKIEGDGKELLAAVISSRQPKPQDVHLSIKGVQKLRLIVDYGEDLDLGDHVDFADARIIK